MTQTLRMSEVDQVPKKRHQEILQELEQRQVLLEAGYAVSGVTLIGGVLTANPIVAASGAVGAGVAAKEIQKNTQIRKAVRAISEAFNDSEVEILKEIAVPEHGSLDLLAKFLLAKVNFAIALRSQGKMTVNYRKDKEALYRRTKNGGLSQWKPDHIQRLGEQEFWLRKYQNTLLGSSTKQRSRPIIKLLVLTGETRLGNNPEDLYVTMGTEKVLKISRRVTVYILEEKQLVSFLKAFLANRLEKA